MRRFNREVYKETHDIGATARYTSAEFNDLLGSQDRLVVQYSGIKISGTSPTLTVVLEGSNNGVDWVAQDTLFNAAALTAGQVNTAVSLGFPLGSYVQAFARLKVTMAGTNPSAQVQLFACGRSTR